MNMSSSFIKRGSTRTSDDMKDDDTDDKDDTKRKSRNLSEKKRRDQFNLLVHELSSMVTSNSRKMDKSTVLKSTISFLKSHNEIAVRSRAHEIQEDWKPSFLSNEEFTHLILEALDGFIMVFSSSGRIFYASESVTSLLGHLPNDLLNMTIYDLVFEDDHSELYNILLNPSNALYSQQYGDVKENRISFSCHLKCGSHESQDEVMYEHVHFVGYFRSDIEPVEEDSFISSTSRYSGFLGEADSRLVFVGTGRLHTPLLIREMSVVDSTKSEFTSRHSLEWKFLFLDHRAPPIIGYLPFEVLGTSGYDYYHIDDLEKVVTCHEALMEKGEGTSCHYRFLTKGQQWIWLQTRFYITYHQWNSKPEFIVCTHRVVSYVDVIKHLRRDADEGGDQSQGSDAPGRQPQSSPSQSGIASSPWPSRSPGSQSSKAAHAKVSPSAGRSRRRHSSHGASSDTASDSRASGADSSRGSRQSQPTSHSAKSRSSLQMVGKAVPLGSQQLLPSSVAGFTKPQAQYMAAVPVQPVLAAGVPGAGPIVPALPASELVMTTTQTHIQDQLQRKHEELQQLIMQQQEELLRVSEQLFMARYGLLPQLQLNVTLPFSEPGAAVSSTTSSLGARALAPQALPGYVTGTAAMSLGQATRPAPQPATLAMDPRHVAAQRQCPANEGAGGMLQLSQQQAQLLFTVSSSDQHAQ
ncbi:circadian locomoter output cycles protein kaput isoform X2 [Bacillus rossius redtenbacheri]|uniref:circadian locomoter output cycles protein kaput isoform X2 n=1 Tax=Bacillus rossius redtenbacheri TaxID=93214 RepID=UPI002FDCC5DD